MSAARLFDVHNKSRLLSVAERKAVLLAFEALRFGIPVSECLGWELRTEDRLRTRGDQTANRNVRLDTNDEVIEVLGRDRLALHSCRVRNRVHQMLAYGPTRERVLKAIRRRWAKRLDPASARVASELSRLRESGVSKGKAVATVAR